MGKPLKILNEDKIKSVDKCIKIIRRGLLKQTLTDLAEESYFGERTLYHYTSIEKLFSILSTDSMWASRSRFSNDASEGKTLGQEWLDKHQYYGDEFILCFCGEDDILSQWRGYCPEGGASIGFRFQAEYGTYTLLHADAPVDGAVSGDSIESYKSCPLPVIYCRPDRSSQNTEGVDSTEDILKLVEVPYIKKLGIDLEDIVPYLKNSYFREERELRVVFNNRDQALEKCIRFRKLDDGSMVPYIIVKCGDLLEMGRKLRLTYTDEVIEQLFKENIDSPRRKTIIIPCGQDQDVICAELSNKIQDYRRRTYDTGEWERWQTNPARIVCGGHLPVVSITVGPSPDQMHMKEVIERFCRSRYWLQNVAIKCSEIPYVAPKL